MESPRRRSLFNLKKQKNRQYPIKQKRSSSVKTSNWKKKDLSINVVEYIPNINNDEEIIQTSNYFYILKDLIHSHEITKNRSDNMTSQNMRTDITMDRKDLMLDGKDKGINCDCDSCIII